MMQTACLMLKALYVTVAGAAVTHARHLPCCCASSIPKQALSFHIAVTDTAAARPLLLTLQYHRS